MEQAKHIFRSLKNFIFRHKLISLLIGCFIFFDASLIGVISDSQTKVVKEKLMFSPTPSLAITLSPTPNVLPTLTRKKMTPTFSPRSVTITATSVPTSQPTSKPLTPTTPPSPKDTEAPHSTIFTPKEGDMTYYLQDGKPCAVMFAPTDNVTPANEIETEYKFDDENWSGYANAFDTSRSYLCRDFANGSAHTLYVRSKDKAGNIEEAQVRHFTAQRPN